MVGQYNILGKLCSEYTSSFTLNNTKKSLQAFYDQGILQYLAANALPRQDPDPKTLKFYPDRIKIT